MPTVPVPVQRVLDAAERKGMRLDIRLFDRSTHTAAEAAAAVGGEIGQIVKSLVFVADGVDGIEPVLVLASGANTVDIALVASTLTEPTLRRATADEARELTGYVIGGIPPFGHSKQIRTLMDPDLGRFEMVWAAAGSANAVFPISPASLRVLTNAIVTPIAAVHATGPGKQAASASNA
jgi:prolyl-tRNA editing enzyme YbaK/EbsC (Cys-tRNA(Pro) deacylase)